MPVSVRIDGLDRVRKLLSGIEKRAKSDSRAMDIIGVMGENFILRESFGKESGPNGKWAPLKQRTGKILQDTGAMRLRTGHIARNHQTILYNSSSYAPFHHDGTSRMPQRKFMWISNKEVTRMAKVYLDYMLGKR